MKRAGFIFFVLFITATALLIITYIFPKPSMDIALKDIPSAIAPDTISKEPVMLKITLIDSTETEGDNNAQVDYYIIVESFRNLTQARQRADKLINDFNTNIIVLPPTKEGYYRISYGKYSTLDEVKSIIKRVRTDVSSDAWILSIIK